MNGRFQNKTQQLKNRPWVSVDGYFDDQEFGGGGGSPQGFRDVGCSVGIARPTLCAAPRSGAQGGSLVFGGATTLMRAFTALHTHQLGRALSAVARLFPGVSLSRSRTVSIDGGISGLSNLDYL